MVHRRHHAVSVAAGDLLKEGRGIGASSVLQARVVWRRVCRDPDAFTATMTALLASAALGSERAQTAITHLFVTVAFRFVRPPAIRAATVPCTPFLRAWFPLCSATHMIGTQVTRKMAYANVDSASFCNHVAHFAVLAHPLQLGGGASL